MSTENQSSVSVAPIQQQPIALGNRGVQLSSYEEMYRFAKSVAISGLAPKGIEKPESILVALQLGLELGLSPMAALQNIAVINGKPGIYGDAALALVRSSGLLDKYSQRWEGTGDARKATVTVLRRGDAEPITSSFSVADAKAAGLWGKTGPWSQYPDRMMLFRARGFALRDAFGDVLKGLRTSEELEDMPRDVRNVTPAKSEAAASADADEAALFPEKKEETAAV